MNENESTPETEEEGEIQVMSPFLPLLLLAISFALLLISLDSSLSTQRTGLNQALAQRNQLLQQSPQIQERLQKLFTDLGAIANTDADARAIIQRSGIQITPPAQQAPAK